MPMLLEDLADEASAGIGMTADRLCRELDDLRRAPDQLAEAQQAAVRSARLASTFTLPRVQEAEAVWRRAVEELQATPNPARTRELLPKLRHLFEAQLRLVRVTRGLWAVAERLGAVAEDAAALEAGEGQLAGRVAGLTKVIRHREGAWQPKDPERAALGLQLAREGKTVSAEEARAWFRH